MGFVSDELGRITKVVIYFKLKFVNLRMMEIII